MAHKRPLSRTSEAEDVPAKKQCQNKHWSLGLLNYFSDTTSHVFSDSSVVIIKDKYPKAEVHYLVLPKDESLHSLTSLDKQHHLTLLQHMDDVAVKYVTRKHPSKTFKMGYHSRPSMRHLHLHVISDDMNSPYLKNKKHWNSYNTHFFLPSQDVCRRLEKGVEKLCPFDDAKCDALLKSELACHKCTYKPKNMPELKKHLLSHL